MSIQTQIRTCTVATCLLCGAPGKPVYTELKDVLYGVPGSWSILGCTSARCGLLWLSPRPIPADTHRLYTRYYTHSNPELNTASGTTEAGLYQHVYDGVLQLNLGYRRGTGPAWHRLLAPLAYLYPSGIESVLASVLFLPAPCSERTILDVGCGNGDLLVQLRALGWHVRGNDTDADAAEAARARGIDVRIGALTDDLYDQASVDVISMVHVLEHVSDPLALLAAAQKTLKKHGQLIIVTPNTQSLGHRLFGRDWRGLEPPRHFFLYNSQAIVSLLQQAGFRHISVRTLARGSRYILTMSEQIRRARKNGWPAIGFGHDKPSRRSRSLQLCERGLLPWLPTTGEELFVQAERPE